MSRIIPRNKRNTRNTTIPRPIPSNDSIPVLKNKTLDFTIPPKTVNFRSVNRTAEKETRKMEDAKKAATAEQNALIKSEKEKMDNLDVETKKRSAELLTIANKRMGSVPMQISQSKTNINKMISRNNEKTTVDTTPLNPWAKLRSGTTESAKLIAMKRKTEREKKEREDRLRAEIEAQVRLELQDEAREKAYKRAKERSEKLARKKKKAQDEIDRKTAEKLENRIPKTKTVVVERLQEIEGQLNKLGIEIVEETTPMVIDQDPEASPEASPEGGPEPSLEESPKASPEPSPEGDYSEEDYSEVEIYSEEDYSEEDYSEVEIYSEEDYSEEDYSEDHISDDETGSDL